MALIFQTIPLCRLQEFTVASTPPKKMRFYLLAPCSRTSPRPPRPAGRCPFRRRRLAQMNYSEAGWGEGGGAYISHRVLRHKPIFLGYVVMDEWPSRCGASATRGKSVRLREITSICHNLGRDRRRRTSHRAPIHKHCGTPGHSGPVP